MFEKVVTVLGAKKVNFNNNGDVIQGVQVWYYMEPVNELDVVGCVPVKAWLKDLSAYENFKDRNYPTNARLKFDIDIAKNKLIPKSFEFDYSPSKK